MPVVAIANPTYRLNSVQQNLQRNISETRRSMDEHLSGRNKKKTSRTPAERLIQMMENFKAKTPPPWDCKQGAFLK